MSVNQASHQLKSMVEMANQIASHITQQGDQSATDDAVLNHILKFWSRSMKQEIKEHVARGGFGLSDRALQALKKL